jgi:hypothetical protein
MPEKRTVQRARKKLRQGKSPSTAAGEFVREEIHHVREGKHGARSPQQAIAIGLSKARRAGVPLARKKGIRAPGKRHGRPSRRRAAGVTRALKREPRGTTSRRRLAGQTHRAAARRGARDRYRAAMRAVRTKGRSALRRAARKAARTRQRA